MGRKPGVFSGKNSALIGHKLFQQVDILEIERVNGEVDFGLRPRRADFGKGTATAAAFVGLVRASFARHSRLFGFAMERWASQSRVVLFDLEFLGLEFLVARSSITRRRFAFFARLCAFNGDDFPGHNYSF